MRINKINREEYHELHILVHNGLHKEFKEMLLSYNEFGNNKAFDNTTMSEVVRMLISNLVAEYDNTSDANFQLMKKLSNFRDAGAGVKQ